MKATKQCPKCKSRKIGCLESQPDYDGRGVDKPRSIGIARRAETGLLGTRRRDSYVGVLEAYVCTECGYYESYVAQPRKVPWDQVVGMRMLSQSDD